MQWIKLDFVYDRTPRATTPLLLGDGQQSLTHKVFMMHMIVEYLDAVHLLLLAESFQ